MNSKEWTATEELILVNQIGLMEWLKPSSTSQKWSAVVANCSALGVTRNLYQFRTKWTSLLSDYNLIKQWNSKAGRGGREPYWCLDSEEKEVFGLPDSFDDRVFNAIHEYVRSHWEEPDNQNDPDTDPEAEAELLQVIAKLGSRRKRTSTATAAVLQEAEQTLQGPVEAVYQQVADIEQKLETECIEANLEQPHPVETLQPFFTEEKQQLEDEEAHLFNKMKQPSIEDNLEQRHLDETFQPFFTEEKQQEQEEEHLFNKMKQPSSEENLEQHHLGETFQPFFTEEKQEEEEAHLWARETVLEMLQQDDYEAAAQESHHVQECLPKEPDHEDQQCPMMMEENNTEQKSQINDDGEESCEMEVEKDNNNNKCSLGEQRPHKRGRKPKALVEEEMMAEKVYDMAQLMLAVAKGDNIPPLEDGLGGDCDLKGQADRIMGCLGQIVDVLDRYPYLVQKYG